MKVYKPKYKTAMKWLEVVAILAIAFAILFITIFNTAQAQAVEISGLRETQQIIVMPIDGCNFIEQLQNSNDSTVRWTIKK